jgi:glycosyltransferase involved in cell wall biosynthesis
VRDEAHQLRRTLGALLRTPGEHVEFIVLDDVSADDSHAIARSFARGDARLRVLRGKPLPPGWLGKNWACHQLARAARGDVLIFCDADVEAREDAVRASVASLERWRADALTGLPRHSYAGWLDAAVLPLVLHLPVAGLLPLPFVALPRSSCSRPCLRPSFHRSAGLRLRRSLCCVC